MGRKKKDYPSLRRHKGTGQGLVTLSGHDHYCGAWPLDREDAPAQVRTEYDRLISEWVQRGRTPLAKGNGQTNGSTRATATPRSHGEEDTGISVAALCVAYMRHAGGILPPTRRADGRGQQHPLCPAAPHPSRRRPAGAMPASQAPESGSRAHGEGLSSSQVRRAAGAVAQVPQLPRLAHRPHVPLGGRGRAGARTGLAAADDRASAPGRPLCRPRDGEGPPGPACPRREDHPLPATAGGRRRAATSCTRACAPARR
jgi:hypothetical protein